jgi:hypothetical protein
MRYSDTNDLDDSAACCSPRQYLLFGNAHADFTCLRGCMSVLSTGILKQGFFSSQYIRVNK